MRKDLEKPLFKQMIKIFRLGTNIGSNWGCHTPCEMTRTEYHVLDPTLSLKYANCWSCSNLNQPHSVNPLFFPAEIYHTSAWIPLGFGVLFVTLLITHQINLKSTCSENELIHHIPTANQLKRLITCTHISNTSI